VLGAEASLSPDPVGVSPAALDRGPARDGQSEAQDPIVVVGMGIAVPGASSPQEFWSQMTSGAELFVPVPTDRWPLQSFYHPDPQAPDKTYQSRSGFITSFTPHPRLARELPSLGNRPEFTTLWLRHCAYQALDGVATAAGDRYSVCIGYTPDGSQHLSESLISGQLAALLTDSDQAADPNLATDVQALRERCLPFAHSEGAAPVPHRIGQEAFRGLVPPDSRLLMVDTACSSSLYAIDLGVRELVSGRCEIALCGGAFALAPGGSVLFSKLQGLSHSGEVRALDRSADGVLFSDGAGIVVLKKLSRALADGNQVLGVVAGTGLSADGRGKAIYAPSSAGQELAISRAFDRSGMDSGEVDWVIAHATGTPAGDEAEFLALRTGYNGLSPVQVTSNKSLIGHTGWAAGVVSVIHALLAIQHQVIPAQYRFTAAPERFGIDTTNLTIPAEPVPWPAHPQRLRTAAVSGFGFGGTNAHMLVQEYRPGLPNRFGYGQRDDDQTVIVGWSAHLPGAADLTQVGEWAAGAAGPPRSFGSHYRRPPFHKLRMPASAVRATDRTQLMIVECMQRLTEDVRSSCDRHKAKVGVVVGHTGPTRNATLYGLRAYLDELDRGAAFARDPEQLRLLLKQLREYATGQLAAPAEDSFPGEMPNVIAARLCNYFDFHGLNVSVDGGTASLVDAFDTASRYLEFGDIDIALVAGINGNSLDGWQALTDEDGPISEGAFLFAVTRRSLAEAEGLPVLAELATAGHLGTG
jgi:acyl transferase domain-containing protein